MQLQRLPLPALFAATMTATGFAQSDVPLDDFTTGLYQSPAYTSGFYTNTQKGDMLDGSRTTSIILRDFATVCGSANAYNHESSYGTYAKNGDHPSGLEETAGFGTQSYLDLEYGSSGKLYANFYAYNRIRVNFTGLTVCTGSRGLRGVSIVEVGFSEF